MRNFGFRAATSTVLCVFVLLPVLALAQNTPTRGTTPPSTTAQSPARSTDMQILLDKLKADKKLVVASNMELTEPQKMTFWPIYDAYQKDLQGINDRLVKAIKAYADGYNNKSITDDQAKKLTDEILAIEADEAKLRSTYATKLNAALPGKVVARYMQIESKIRAALRYDMASNIPLVP
jgi:hypothetical protein